MKTPTSYFLLALTVLSVATTITALRPVYDMDGDIIFTGSYYVLPFIKGQGGGVRLTGQAHDIPSCPTDIVQSPFEMDEGLPVRFSNWMLTVAFVPQNMNLNIETVRGPNICMRPTYWWVDLFTIEMKHTYLAVGPTPGSPEDSLNSFFQIQEVSGKYVYKIKFCREGSQGVTFCGDVGIIVDENGARRLAITKNKPFLVQFKKVNVIESVLSNNM